MNFIKTRLLQKLLMLDNNNPNILETSKSISLMITYLDKNLVLFVATCEYFYYVRQEYKCVSYTYLYVGYIVSKK